MSQLLDRFLESLELPRVDRNKLGLEPVVRVAEELGVTSPADRVVVVAGTNGKGSTVRCIETLLLAAGHSVGCTASPHMYNYNERIRINGHEVCDESILGALKIVDEARGITPLTYYEMATLAALVIFGRKNVQRIVLEVGLGGRLDAANVVRRHVNVITNIAIDHQEILGADRESIGSEKVGIAQKSVPLVYADKAPVNSVLERAAALNCPLYQWGSTFKCGLESDGTWRTRAEDSHSCYEFALPTSPSMPIAAAIAVQTTLLLEGSITANQVMELSRCQLPGRFERFNWKERTWVLDVAHNPSAALYLRKQIENCYPNRNILVLIGCLQDKDVAGIVEALKVSVDRIAVTNTSGQRAQSAEITKTKINEAQVATIPSLTGAIDHLRNRSQENDLILVTGSFDVVARTRNVIVGS